MPFYRSDYHNLHYITVGDRTRPPLLLLHGFLGNHQDFTTVTATLSQSFYCILPDLPGHGKTQTEPNGYTFAATATTLVALLTQLNLQPSKLLGYSMGGRIALYLTCQFPQYFSAVVLESASPGLQSPTAQKERARWDDAIARKIETTPLPQFLNQWYQHPMFANLQQYPERYNNMLHRRQKNQPTEVANALRGLSTGRQPSLWQALPHIQQPLLLLVGALDSKFVSISQEMANTTESDRPLAINVLKNCGHNVHLEEPEQYAQIVTNFLKPAS